MKKTNKAQYNLPFSFDYEIKSKGKKSFPFLETTMALATISIIGFHLILIESISTIDIPVIHKEYIPIEPEPIKENYVKKVITKIEQSRTANEEKKIE